MSTPRAPIWHNGRLVPAHEATCHVLSHALHYGSAIFEGVRAYPTPKGLAFFQLDAHLERLWASARMYRMQMPFDAATLRAACCEVAAASGLDALYLRPLVYRGDVGLGVVPRAPACEVAIAALPWGPYLGEGALAEGVAVGVSSWQRPAPNTIPTHAKAAGNYLSSQLIALEAKRLGYDEGLALDTRGFVSEGPGENLFMVHEGRLWTPPVTASILPGLTRSVVIRLAQDLGLTVVEADIARDMLYVAEELLFTGTAVELTPIASVDGIAVRTGRPGPITRRLQDRFFGLFDGRTPDLGQWLSLVTAGLPTSAPVVQQPA